MIAAQIGRKTTVLANGVACVELGRAGAPTLVCCHGMGLDHTDVLDLVEPLAEAWHIVLWDMPGHGASGPLPSRCTLGTMTDALTSVIDDLAIIDPVLLGFSFGGMVAQGLIRRRVCRIRGLIAMGCFAPYLADPPLSADAAEQVLIAPILALPWNQVCAAFVAACSAHPDVQARLLPAIDRLGRDGLAAMTRALVGGFDRDPSFTIDMPLLVVRGADDVNGEPLAAAARAILAAANDAREIVVGGAGHCVHLDQRDMVLSAITEFLERWTRSA